MSRWLLAIVALGCALASAQAADPKPLWEIDSRVDAKRLYAVPWVSFSQDGKVLIAHVESRTVAGYKEQLIAWNVATRVEKFSVEVTPREELDLGLRVSAVTKAGTVLIGAGPPKEVRLADGKVVASNQLDGFVRGVWCAPNNPNAVWLFSRGEFDGHSVAVGSMPGFQVEPRKNAAKWPVTRISTLTGLDALVVSPDATRIALAQGEDETQRLRLCALAVDDSVELKEVAAVPRGHKGKISVLQFSPDGQTLATGGQDSTIFLWDIDKAGKDWKPRVTLPGGRMTVGALAFTPDGRTLFAGTWDKAGFLNLFVIDVGAGKVVATHRLEGQLTALAFSPDGKTLVTGDYSGRIKGWDADALRNP